MQTDKCEGCIWIHTYDGEQADEIVCLAAETLASHVTEEECEDMYAPYIPLKPGDVEYTYTEEGDGE